MSDHSSRLQAWLGEAKRRRLFVPIVAYAAVAVTIIELSGAIFEALLLPEWGNRLVTVLLILGFPVVVVLAWVFDLTPEGVRRTEGSGDGGPGAPDATPGSPPVASPRVRRVSSPDSRTPVSPAGTAARAGAVTPEGVREDDDPPPSGPPDPERVKRAALGHVRHELKTPINGILGYSEMLLEDLGEEDDPPEELEGDLKKVHEAGGRLLALVDEILSPAQALSDAPEPDLEEYGAQIRVDLRNPINAVVGYAELLKETSLETDRGYLVPDLERIEQAARRLLDLSTDIVQVATAHLNEGDPSGRARLEEASALTQDLLAKARPRRKVQGADAMGSLLVVDDNAMNRDLLSRQLARAGYLVQTAESGRDALDLLREREFDLVLLDVIMPDMDGLEVLRSVKADPKLAATPIIMLSSLDDVESAIRCVELGAEDFLSKPFHPTLLQARIGATLEVRHLREREAGHRAHLAEAERFADRLLRSSIPDTLAERVRAGESGIVESYPRAAILWCDVERAARNRARDPALVAGRIQRIMNALDGAARDHQMDVLARAGDGIAIASGIPVPGDDDPGRIARMALALRDELAGDEAFDAPVRLGLDAGEVNGGVLGGERLSYRLWGDPVDLARTLGESASSGEIRVSPGAFRLLRDRWGFASLGVQEIAGQGQMQTYLLEGPA